MVELHSYTPCKHEIDYVDFGNIVSGTAEPDPACTGYVDSLQNTVLKGNLNLKLEGHCIDWGNTQS
jgi:hypothetical protein